MILKKGVNILGVQPHTVVAMVVADSIYKMLGYEGVVITSVKDGAHAVDGAHPTGDAFDCRIRDLDQPTDADGIAIEMKAQLGDRWLVIVEKDHIHVQLRREWR